MQDGSLIRFQDAHFSYQNGSTAIRGISFEIYAGELVCFVGKNGSGKSTVAHLIDGLIRPDSGYVNVFGISADSRANIFSIRSRIGYVFQNPSDQIINTVVENEVAFGPENLGLSAPEIRKRVDESLAITSMETKKTANVNSLSGGQMQRVALADALAMNPDILIFDEATSMLDAQGAADFLELVKSLHASGKTIIMITHSLDEACLGDRIICMDDGRITYDGAPQRDILTEAFPELPTEAELKKIRSSCAMTEKPSPAPTPTPTPTSTPAPTPTPAANTATHTPVIEFAQVGFDYHAPKKKDRQGGIKQPLDQLCLHDINLKIYPGETVAIMGANGSGKSTLIKHMNGLVRPTAGVVLVKGVSTAENNGANRARSVVGVCFQYPERQLFAQTVYDDIAYGPAHIEEDTSIIDACVRAAMREVSLDFDTYAGKSPFNLSGGEQRRVALAGTLATDPEVLVLDEPCASLDPHTHIEFIYLIERLKSSGKTIIIVTHDAREAALLADRILVMENGTIRSDYSKR